MTPVDEPQLQERLAHWQKLLRLQDWDVDIKIVRRHAMPKATSLAGAQIDRYRRVKILLLDPVDWHPDDWPADRDLEISLVHELLHCVFYDAGSPKEDSPEDLALERAVEATALALITLDRQARA